MNIGQVQYQKDTRPGARSNERLLDGESFMVLDEASQDELDVEDLEDDNFGIADDEIVLLEPGDDEPGDDEPGEDEQEYDDIMDISDQEDEQFEVVDEA